VFFLSSQLHHVSNIEAQSPAFSYSHSFFFFPKRSCHNRRRCRCHNRSPFHRTTFLPPFSRRHNCCIRSRCRCDRNPVRSPFFPLSFPFLSFP
ncbi:unnamed protein product, partial [Musa acuminata subsp. burmannicoides]